MARTMTDEQERDIFAACDNDWTYTEQTYRKWCQSLKAELEAERAEHKLTEAAASAEAQRHDELLAEVRALKERLKRAEAVCEFMEARDLRMNDALAAWRAGK